MAETKNVDINSPVNRTPEGVHLAIARVSEPTAAAESEPRPRRSRRRSTANLHSEIREDVQVILTEWLNERSSSLAMGLSHLLEGYLPKVRREHASELAQIQSTYQERIARLERERDDSTRAFDRRAQELASTIEADYRERLDRLQRDVDAAALDGRDRIREIQLRERDEARVARHELEDRLREREAEIARLKQAHLTEVTLLKRTFDRELAARDRRTRGPEPPPVPPR